MRTIDIKRAKRAKPVRPSVDDRYIRQVAKSLEWQAKADRWNRFFERQRRVSGKNF